jgi:hypothetical protein
METTGLLKEVFDTQKVSDKFQKRDFVLTTEASTPYPQHISFQLTQDKCSILDSFQKGEEIKVQFNLRGREWSGPQGVKYFNTLEAWRVEKVTGGASAPAATSSAPAATSSAPASTPAPVFNSSFSDNDDLPF